MSAESYPEEELSKWLAELRPFLYRLLDTWSVRRLDNTTRDSYLDQAKRHVQELMNEMITESEDKTQRLVEEIKHLMESLAKLSKELDKKVDLSPYEDLPLDLVKEKLDQEAQKLQKCKEELTTRFKKLRQKEYEICKKTGAKPIHFSSKLLGEGDLNEFARYVEVQQVEKDQLESKFLHTREKIIAMLESLEVTPDDEFQMTVVQDPGSFMYTKENMQILSKWEKHLKTRIELFEKSVATKKEEVQALWAYLEEPINHRQDFLHKHSESTPQTYRALEAEIERCKAKRAENMAKYVGKMREELENLWDLCKFSEEQRNNFVPIHCQNYTDSLLTLHEMEVERLRKFYQENKKIFSLVQDFESIIEQMKVLDRRAMDPDRLHNRGGQLLAEEKERKIANKKLPKIQEQITEHLVEYERMNDEPFTLNGLTVSDYFEKIWDEYNKEKENIKSEVKKQAKDKSMKKTPVNSSKRTPRAVSIRQIDPSKSVKRKLIDDSSASSQAKGQASGEKSKKKRTPNYVVPKRGKFVTRKSLNHSKSRKNTSKTQSEGASESFSSSYEQFQEHLQQRDDLRSSCLPQQMLQSMQPKMKTPVKTPAKPLQTVTRRKIPVKSPISLCPPNTSSRTPRSLRSNNTSTRAVTPNSRSPKVKTQLTLAPTNMPLFL